MKHKNLFIVFLLFLSCNVIYGNQIKIISKLIDTETNQPIEFARVCTAKSYTFSNADGEFEIVADSADIITISHIGYGELKYKNGMVPATIKWNPLYYELAETIVMPETAIIQKLNAVRNRYVQLLKHKFPTRNYYYRQLTSVEDIYTEYLEGLFSGISSSSIKNISLLEGRYGKKDSVFSIQPLSLINNYVWVGVSYALSEKKASTSNQKLNAFLCKDFDKIYDISLLQIINPDTESEIQVYKFVPKIGVVQKAGIFLSGQLYVRIRDNSIVRLEANSSTIELPSSIGYQFKGMDLTVSILYGDLGDSCPSVETIKTKSNILFVQNGKEYRYQVMSFFSITNMAVEEKGRKLKAQENLIDILYRSNYKNSFWDNNPMIKRTDIEQKVLDEFKEKDYFKKFDVQ